MNAAPNAAPPDVKLLQLAVQNLACAPQAQRRYVQMGLMSRAVDNVNRLGADPQPLVDAGELTPEQAELVAKLQAELARQLEEHEDFLEERDAGPREFLFGHALENEGWHTLRHLARESHSALVGDASPFMAIMAK